MRVSALTASLLLGAAFISTIGLMTVPAKADQAKAACPCNCPNDSKVKPGRAEARAIPHHPAPRYMRRYAEGGYYSYRDAAPVYRREWHGVWRVAPRGYVEPEGLVIDQSGWAGGVGYGEEGGGGGYGQVLLTSGNSQNGPTYNSFGESFQQNPSMAHPFQNRLRGGLAPTGSSSGSK